MPCYLLIDTIKHGRAQTVHDGQQEGGQSQHVHAVAKEKRFHFAVNFRSSCIQVKWPSSKDCRSESDNKLVGIH